MVGLRSGVLLLLLLGSGWTSAKLSERSRAEDAELAAAALAAAPPVDRTVRLAIGDSFAILYFIPTDTTLRVSGSRVKCLRGGNSQFRVRLYRGTTNGAVLGGDSIPVACGQLDKIYDPQDAWPCWTAAMSMRDAARDTVGRPACSIGYPPPVRYDTVTREWVTVTCVWMLEKDTAWTRLLDRDTSGNPKGGYISCYPGGVPYDSTHAAAARVRRPPIELNPDTEPYPYRAPQRRRPAVPIRLEKP